MSTGNSTKTAKKKVVGRPFRKGVSGNPSGRPAGFVTMIRELTNDGKDLIEFFDRVWRDEGMNPKFRIDAAIQLTNRGFGMPIQATDNVHTIQSNPLAEMTKEEILKLAKGGK